MICFYNNELRMNMQGVCRLRTWFYLENGLLLKMRKWDELSEFSELNYEVDMYELLWWYVIYEHALLMWLSMNALFSVNYLEKNGFCENLRTLSKGVFLIRYLANDFRNMITW